MTRLQAWKARLCDNCGHIMVRDELLVGEVYKCLNCGQTMGVVGPPPTGVGGVEVQHDDVSSPDHYKIKHGPLAGKYEVIDVLESFPHIVGDGRLMQAVQCILRAPEKEGDKDIEKARWFIDRYLKAHGRD